MNHFASASFWSAYDKLPPEIREAADQKFALLKENPRYPSLHFKKVGRFWSVRVNLHYRAVGVEAPDGIVWITLIPHAAYDRMIKS
ncbi:MAG TPA: hypothetical protein VGG48_08830 [Rhizomicrobium sp.]|jgi:hypothetical protein